MLSIERQFIRTERPLYGHLVTLLETAIAKGELPSGTRVPPERTLAQQLKISRTIVVSAYRELDRWRSATACRSSRTRRIAISISTRRRRRRCASSTTTTSGDAELRLCLTSVLPSTIEESIKRLARCVGEVRLTA